MSADTVEARVARGVALLDGQWPDWPEHVDLRTFDITSPCRCVVGQLFGRYVPERLGISVFADSDYGFEVYEGDVRGDSYDALQAEWTRVIESRRVAP